MFHEFGGVQNLFHISDNFRPKETFGIRENENGKACRYCDSDVMNSRGEFNTNDCQPQRVKLANSLDGAGNEHQLRKCPCM